MKKKKKDLEKEIELAKEELFVPNKKKRILKCMFTILLFIIVCFLAFIYFFKNDDNNIEVKARDKKVFFDALALEMAINEERNININVKDGLNARDIVFTTDDDKVSGKCENTTCKIKANKIGLSKITVSIGNEKDTIPVRVVKNKKIYAYTYGNSYNNYGMYISGDEDSEGKLLYTYTCKSLDCKTITYSYNILIKDSDGYHLINPKTKKEIATKLDYSKYERIDIVDSNSTVYGFVLNDKYFYSVKSNKNTIEINDKKEYFVVNYTGYPLNVILVQDSEAGITHLYDMGNGNLTHTFNTIYSVNKLQLFGKDYIITESDEYYSIYTSDFKLVFDKVLNYKVTNDKLYIIFADKINNYYAYDNNFNVIFESKSYKMVDQFVEDYVIVIDNEDYLKLINIDEVDVHTFVKLNDNMIYHNLLSGYYEENNKNGIYVVVEDDTLNHDDDKLTQGYEYYYIPTTGESGKIRTEIGGYAKPILYFYPTKDNTRINVKFEKPELLTTTYPKYIKEWNVNAFKDGTLYDLKGKSYYALYWEEATYKKQNFKTGFYVTKDNAIEFLEEKLSYIGLNDKESNEMIMYWLPILEKNGKNLVYFELTEERNEFNRLIINPNPDSILRVAIHIKKVNKKTSIKEQKLTQFDRKGFAAVEWGGVNY